MPHPHEQKLHEVVNSLTSESFKSFVAARIAGTSRSPPIANPVPPPTVNFSQSLRFNDIAFLLEWALLIRTKQAQRQCRKWVEKLFYRTFRPG